VLALQLVHPPLASWWAGQIRLHLLHFEVSSSERARTHQPPVTRLMACPFPKGEGDAQQVLCLEESASQMSCFLFLTEFQKIPHSLWGWSVQSAQVFEIAAFPVVRCSRSVKPHPILNLIKVFSGAFWTRCEFKGGR